MKKIFRIIKVILILVFFAFSGFLIYFLFLTPKEQRFKAAAGMQGLHLSQTMFDVLTLQHPDFAKAYFEQSVAWNKRGEYARGFALLDKAVELDPKMHLGYRGYMKLRFLRFYDDALADFDRLDSLTPNFRDAPWGEDIDFLRGEAYFGKEDYQQAITCFKRSIEQQGEEWADVNSFVYLGLCEAEMGNYEQAKIEFSKALKHYPTTPEAHYGLAEIYHKSGDHKYAKEHLLKAEENLKYKREDPYNEYLNEIHAGNLEELKMLTEKENTLPIEEIALIKIDL